MGKLTNHDLVAFLLALQAKGSPYWYGTCVYECTESRLKSKAKQYPAHYTDSRMPKYRQDIAEKKICADCIGAIKGFAWTNGGEGVLESYGTGKDFASKYGSNNCPDKSANGMFEYAKKQGAPWGGIDTIPELPGIAVRYDGHVGTYIGNGKVVEWRGFNYGSQITNLKDRKWLHWYYLPFIEYMENGQPQAPEEAPVQPAVQMVEIVSKGGNVNIRSGNGTEYSRVSSVKPGTKLEYVATAINGWHAVKTGDRVGWVSGDYGRRV